jgi:hypothetical protein
MNEDQIDIPKWLFVLMCLFITVSGISAIVLPHPSAWIIPDDCEWLEGIVVNKAIEDTMCVLDACIGDSMLTVEPDQGDDNLTIHVSPVVYHSHSIGDRYQNYLCG